MTRQKSLLAVGKNRIASSVSAGAVLVGICAATVPGAQAGAGDTASFAIEAQSLGSALNAFGSQSGLQVAVSEDLVEGHMAPAISGQLSAEAALQGLLAGSGLTYAFVNENTVVLKQGPSGLQAETGKAESEKEVSFVLEEIIVTAEKRAESLQDIPIAISAFSSEGIEKSGVTGISDLRQIAPSLQFGQTSIDNFVSIRGIGSELQNVGAEAGVTVSVDGISLVNHVMFDADFLDVERVEVLRGPQGTISGRNATGGAINIHSKRPTTEFEGGIKATIGNYDRLGLEGYISGSLIEDKLQGRIAVRSERSDGWLKNTYRKEEHEGADKVQGRASFIANVSDIVEAYLVFEAMIDRSSPVSGLDLGRIRADEPGFAEARGVPAFDPDTLEYQAELPNTRHLENYRTSLNLTWEINPSVNLEARTGYISHKQDRQDDFDGTIITAAAQTSVIIDAWQLSQEITLTADINDQFDMILGGFYMRGDTKEYVVLGLPLLDFPLESFTLDPREDLHSYAVYTQWRYRFSDEFRLTVGARYTNDTKKYFEEDIILGASSIAKNKETWGAFTPRIAIDYSPVDDVTLYASLSRGFKAGGFNTFSGVGGVPDDYAPEFVWNYEAGVKAAMLDKKLRTSLSVFYMDYTDLQQGLLLTPEGGGIPVQSVRNASAATIKGIEMEAEAFLSENFMLTASGTWLDATFDELMTNDQIFPELGERDLRGNKLVRAPEWQFSVSGEYTIPLGEDWLAIMRADYYWQDQVFFTFFNHDMNSQDSYGLLNLSTAIETLDGQWRVSVFARNILDKRYVSTSTTFLAASPEGEKTRFGNLGEPRMYGISLAYKF